MKITLCNEITIEVKLQIIFYDLQQKIRMIWQASN